MPLTFIDLFCGIGGFHFGIQRALPDAECVLACDINAVAQRKYEAIHGLKPHGDITSITSPPHADLVCGGFPCQPFSSSGLQNGLNDHRGNLFFEIIAFIKRMPNKPILLLENVKNILRIQKGEVLSLFVKTLVAEGYVVNFEVLSPHQFGTPQHRPRVFFVAHPTTAMDFTPLRAEASPVRLCDVLDTTHPPFHKGFTILPEVRETPKTHLRFIGYTPGSVRDPSKKPSSQGYHHDDNRIFGTRGTSPAILTHNVVHLLDEATNTPFTLTKAERHRIMSFPESMNASLHQLGNAVCPVVVEAIVRQMLAQGLLAST